jgi:hypothetical protein
MPKATISSTPVRKDLKTLEGGFVSLRQLSYGEWLKRQDIALAMAISDGENGKAEGVMKSAQGEVAKFEFANVIVDHNLEGDGDTKLDFKANGLQQLDPRVGAEIAKLIAEMHEFDLGN